MKSLKKLIGKTLLFSLAFSMTLSSFSFASEKEDEFKNLEPPLYYLRAAQGEDEEPVNKTQEIKDSNYWSNLEFVKFSAKDPNKSDSDKDYNHTLKTLIPKYLLGPDESAINVYAQADYQGGGMNALYFNSAGIAQDKSALLNPLDFASVLMDPNAELEYCKRASDLSYNVVHNIFDFTEGDLLTLDQYKNSLTELRVLGDLKKKDSKNSKGIDELKVNENLNLEFSLKADWFRKYFNGYSLIRVSIGGEEKKTNDQIKEDYRNVKAMSDSQMIFSFEIPNDLKVDNEKLKAEFIDDKDENKGVTKIKDLFDINTEIKEEKDGEKTKKFLVISLRKKVDSRAKEENWYNFIKKLNKVDTSNIRVLLSGLSVSENVGLNKNITIKANIGGYYDFALSNKSGNFVLPKKEANAEYSERFFWTFAAVQDPEGLDEAAPKDRPNQISYTFKVAPAPKPEPKPDPTPKPEEPTIEFKPHEYVERHPVNAIIRDKALEELIHEKYIFGYPEDIIKPEGNMTRAEAVSVVARLQKLPQEDGSKIFKDTKDSAWYNKAINAAYKAGYLEEKEGENFRPDEKITRAELAQLISHIDKKNNKIAPFEDIKGHKYEKAINMAYGNERIKGYPDGTFRPDEKITRAEVASMLNKLYNRYPDKTFIDANKDKIHTYKDLTNTHWAYYELVEAYETHKYHRLANNMEEWIDIIK